MGVRAIGFPAWDSTIAESAKRRRRGVGGSEGEIDLVGTQDEGEKFWNFDQEKDELTSKRDHAVCMFFYQNAEVDKVKDMYWGVQGLHDTRYVRLYEYYRWEYDQDKGTREWWWVPLPISARHMRVYAPYPEDRFYDAYLGYFVIGTVHWDYSSKTEEDTEDSLCDYVRD